MGSKLTPLTVDEKIYWAINSSTGKQLRWNVGFVAAMQLRQYEHFTERSYWMPHNRNADPNFLGMIFGVCVYRDKKLGTGIAELVCEDGTITVDLLNDNPNYIPGTTYAGLYDLRESVINLIGVAIEPVAVWLSRLFNATPPRN